jgi:hypothetical protein
MIERSYARQWGHSATALTLVVFVAPGCVEDRHHDEPPSLGTVVIPADPPEPPPTSARATATVIADAAAPLSMYDAALTKNDLSWIGTYHFAAKYVVTVERNGEKLRAEVSTEGAATKRHFYGDSRSVTPQVFDVYFDRCGDDDAAKCKGLARGLIALSMVRKASQTVLQFGALEPPEAGVRELVLESRIERKDAAK